MEEKEYYTHDYTVEDEKFARALKYGKFFKIPKINKAEREILEFCHNRDMREFLREEFEKHPIKLDENGNLIGGNPFDEERRRLGITEDYHYTDPLFNEIAYREKTEQ